MKTNQLDSRPANPGTTPHKPLLSRRELAARWGCSKGTIRGMEATGLLTAVRFNRRYIRYTLQNILAVEATGKGAQ